MPTEETKKIIKNLLAQADVAASMGQWHTVRVLAEEVLKLDPADDDALAYRTVAGRVVINTAFVATGREIKTQTDMFVLADPNAAAPPADPNDAIYYSVSAAQFIGQIPECFENFGANVRLRETVGVGHSYLHAPLNLPDGIRIWGWRCSVNSEAGSVTVSLVKSPYRLGPGPSNRIGEQQVSTMNDHLELSQTGLNEVIDNRHNSYYMHATLEREVSDYSQNDVRVRGAVIICRPS